MRRSLLATMMVVIVGCGAEPIAEPAQAPDSTVDVATTTTAASEVIPDPVRITGYRIGDKVNIGETPGWVNEDGTVDLAKIPEWIAISKDGVVIGYQHNDPTLEALTPDQIDPTSHPELLIYDAAGAVIGRFVDGEPVIGNGARP